MNVCLFALSVWQNRQVGRMALVEYRTTLQGRVQEAAAGKQPSFWTHCPTWESHRSDFSKVTGVTLAQSPE